MIKILIVEDDPAIAEALSEYVAKKKAAEPDAFM